ncbi:MAG: hypothetical protein M3Z04_01865 [Chloroflexota bacterium]|nr:hypothetical protein [Chloroflexota bacterium]
MRIVVNHLTRMQPGYICVAGVDLATGRHVRPVSESGRLGTVLLVRERGPFDIAAVADLGQVKPAGQAPEWEDYRFERFKARRVESLAPADFWRSLTLVSATRLRDLFGPDLRPNGHGATVDVGQGKASLGCLAGVRPVLYIGADGKVRAQFRSEGFDLDLSVTDIRLYEADGLTPRAACMTDLNRRLAAGVMVILSLGLGRAWLKAGEAVSHHWLQLNNLHLADDPAWQDVAR